MSIDRVNSHNSQALPQYCSKEGAITAFVGVIVTTLGILLHFYLDIGTTYAFAMNVGGLGLTIVGLCLMAVKKSLTVKTSFHASCKAFFTASSSEEKNATANLVKMLSSDKTLLPPTTKFDEYPLSEFVKHPSKVILFLQALDESNRSCHAYCTKGSFLHILCSDDSLNEFVEGFLASAPKEKAKGTLKDILTVKDKEGKTALAKASAKNAATLLKYAKPSAG